MGETPVTTTLSQKTLDQLADRYAAGHRLLESESDRAAIIIGAALLDEALLARLKARLAPSPERGDDELLEGHNAPCSHFSARIDLAFRVGAISSYARAALHLVRKIRNEAAHVSDRRTMDTPQIRDRLRELGRLTQDILEALWSVVQGKVPGTESAAGLVDALGWRVTWNILIAVLSASLFVTSDELVQLGRPTPPR